MFTSHFSRKLKKVEGVVVFLKKIFKKVFFGTFVLGLALYFRFPLKKNQKAMNVTWNGIKQ